MTRVRTISDLLCMDIVYELFQFYYVDELFYCFNEVVHHLPLVLKEGHVQLHVRYIDARFRKHILPHIEVNNVISIRIPNLYQMAPVDLSQFNKVRLLILHNVSAINWPRDFPIKLKYLSIHVRSKDRQAVFKKTLSLNNVERLEFSSTFLHFQDSDDKLDKPSTIKHLVFNSQRCFIDYQFLLNNIPHLQSLRSINTYYPHRFKTIVGKFNYLHTIDLVCKHIDIDVMIHFLEDIAEHSLRRCRLVNTINSLSSGIAGVLIS